VDVTSCGFPFTSWWRGQVCFKGGPNVHIEMLWTERERCKPVLQAGPRSVQSGPKKDTTVIRYSQSIRYPNPHGVTRTVCDHSRYVVQYSGGCRCGHILTLLLWYSALGHLSIPDIGVFPDDLVMLGIMTRRKASHAVKAVDEIPLLLERQAAKASASTPSHLSNEPNSPRRRSGSSEAGLQCTTTAFPLSEV
jgi:hypothetical protein